MAQDQLHLIAADKLIAQLVNDTCSTLPESERTIDKCDSASLIYNLFRGNYAFSLNCYKEVFRQLQARDFHAIPETWSPANQRFEKQIQAKITYTEPVDTTNFVKKPKKKKMPIPLKRADEKIEAVEDIYLLPENIVVELVTLANQPKNFRQRIKILIRDKCICQLCHQPITSYFDFNLDHIIPRSKGGGNSMENLQAAHPLCNSKRGHADISNYPKPI